MEYRRSDVVPNIAKSWDISEDGRIFTFYLRRMKWSDGHPFTADDWEFYWNDVILNEELTRRFPNGLLSMELPEFRKLDDYTIQWEFPSPYALFIRQLAFRSEEMVAWYPGHYLKQFHPNYVGVEKANALAKEAGLELWFRTSMLNGIRDSIPSVRDLGLENYGTFPATTIVAERNPYYWKVDPEGNQLPYIDRVTTTLWTTSKCSISGRAGEIDMQCVIFCGTTCRSCRQHGAEQLPHPDVAAAEPITSQFTSIPLLRMKRYGAYSETFASVGQCPRPLIEKR